MENIIVPFQFFQLETDCNGRIRMVGLHGKIHYVNKPYSVLKKVKAAIFASLDGEHARAFLPSQNVVLIKIEALHPAPLSFLRSLIVYGNNITR